MRRPSIGITTDADPERAFCRHPYAAAVVRAGGIPLLLPPVQTEDVELLDAMLDSCDALLFSGGDDPRTEAYGAPTHAKATPVDPRRQAFETALLDRIAPRVDLPVLGICLGMQMMALHAGGRLDQHLPDHGERYALHWGRREHRVGGSLGDGVVMSHHRQAVIDPGRLEVVAEAPDGIVEAVRDRSRAWYVGVQWHPEITADPTLGDALLTALIDQARSRGRRGASV